MTNTEQANTEHTEAMEPTEQPMDIETAQRVEQEKITRRAALRKLGFGAGFAAFALLGVDDLARMVGQRMERMAGDNRVAGQIAKEFQQAGIALAKGAGGGVGPSRVSCGVPCQYCGGIYAAETKDLQNCQIACNNCCAPQKGSSTSPCGARADAVIHACQNECAAFFHQGI